MPPCGWLSGPSQQIAVRWLADLCLPPYTEHTTTDRDALAVEIERVRERGWTHASVRRNAPSESSGSSHHGVWCTGPVVPVHGEENDLSR